MRERALTLDATKTREAMLRADTKPLTQKMLAERLAVSPQRLNYWLSGKNAISESHLRQLAAELQCRPHELIGTEAQNFLSALAL